jgi:hypothetical protein
MNFFHHKDLGNHLLQLCPKVVKHPVFTRRANGQSLETLKKQCSFGDQGALKEKNGILY